jgi:hypothetical protein
MAAERASREPRPGGAHPDAPGPAAPDLDELPRRVAGALGHPGALITLSFTAYRRAHPAHLAIKNAGVLLESTRDELWWGDLDLTVRADALRAAAAATGQPLLVVHESGRPAWAAGRGRRGGDDAVVRAQPDGRLEVDPRAGYARGGRLYRQTAAGSARWERRFRREDPAQLTPRERARLLRRLAEVGPEELPGALADARLALVLDVEDVAVVLRVPALGLGGNGEDVDAALADLAKALTAAAPPEDGPPSHARGHAARRPSPRRPGWGHPNTGRNYTLRGTTGRVLRHTLVSFG